MPADTTTAEDSSVNPLTDYVYRVLAVNAAGASGVSEAAVSTPQGAEIFADGFESGAMEAWSSSAP